MASKENQGLQAAVIAFFILTVILAVTTYLGVSSAQSNGEAATKNKEDANAKQAALTTKIGEYNALKTFSGFAAEEEAAAIQAAYEKDIADHAALNLPEDQRSYRALVAALDAANRSKDALLAKAKQDADTYRTETEANLAAMKASLTKAEEAVAQATEDLANERSKFGEDRQKITQQLAQVQSELQAKNDALEALEAQRTKELADMKSRNETLATQNTLYRTQLDEATTTSFEVPDGKVTWVAQRGDRVYLNLGTRNGLRNKVTFSVYDPDQVNVENAKAKAKIEVIGNPGPNSAEARIIEQDYRNPVLPNDVIYSPIWHHGQKQHFALAGAIDLDGDGVSDRKRVVDIIRMNGGEVDAYVDDAGKVVGQITGSTKYLIVGERPEVQGDRAIDPSLQADIDNMATLVGQAQAASVVQIPLQKFLDNVGFAHDVQPQGSSTGATDTDPANSSTSGGSNFRPRQPPARSDSGL